MAYNNNNGNNSDSSFGGTMNTLDPQAQRKKQQEDQQKQMLNQNQPQNVSGGQSSAIGMGGNSQPQQGQQQQAPTQQKASSGMFTNIRKYVERNKAGAGQMAGKLQQNMQQQQQNIMQGVQNKSTDFMSRVEQNRNRLQGAQQFGQQAIQQAQSQESMPMLQQQQQDIQGRISNIGDINDANVQAYQQYQQQFQPQEGQQAQSFEDYTKQQLGYGTAQDAYNQIKSGYDTTKSQYDAAMSGAYSTNPFGGDTSRVVSNIASQGRDLDYENAVINSYKNDAAFLEQQAQQFGNNTAAKEDFLNQQGYYDLKNRIDTYQNLVDLSGQKQSQESTYNEKLNQLQNLQNQLTTSTENRRLLEGKQQLQSELASIQDKINNAPEALTEQDIERFNNLRTGVERFDDAILNLAQQQTQAQDLMNQAQSLSTAQGRRDLMRKEFGRQGGYTSGQAALDNLILTGDREATSNLIQNSQQQAQAAQDEVNRAYQEGRITQDEMSRATANIQKDLQTNLESAQTTLTENLAERARTGEGTFIQQLRDKITSGQGLSQEDMNILGMTGQERFAQDPAEVLRNLNIAEDQFQISDVANMTDLERANALARLGGEAQGQGTFLQDQLGIDELRRQYIENRATANEGDQFTRTRDELSLRDKAAVDSFLSDLGSAKYENVDQARQDIKSSIASYHNNNELEPVANDIQNLVENGNINTRYGTFNLDQVLAGDQNALAGIQDLIYWGNVGSFGIHGRATEFGVIQNAIKEALAKTQALKAAYGADQNNAFRSESESALVGQEPVNRIRG